MAVSKRVSEHLANERTFLAFLRTALALITFGITINRFAIFLIQQKVPLAKQSGITALFGAENAGIAMVAIGALLMLFAARRFILVSNEIERDAYVPQTGFAIATTIVILVGSGLTLAWLFARQ